MKISKVGINTTSAKVNPENTNNLFSNPFGVSFKGNVLQADVFEKASPKIVEKISSKGKLFVSAIVGNINNFSDIFKSKMNSVKTFAKKVQNSIINTVDKLQNTEVTLDFQAFKDTVQKRFFPDSSYKVKNLVKAPVNDLKSMLQEALKA